MATLATSVTGDHGSCYDSINPASERVRSKVNYGGSATIDLAKEIATVLMQYATNPEGYGVDAEDYPALEGTTKIDVISITIGASLVTFEYTVNNGESMIGTLYDFSGCGIAL